MKLKAKLLLVFLFLVAISNMFLLFIAQHSAREELVEAVQKHINTAISSIGTKVHDANDKEFKLLSSLANIPQIKDSQVNLLEKAEIVSSIAKHDASYINIAVYDKNGNSYTDDGRLINFIERPYFKAAINGNSTVLDPEISKVNNQLLIWYSVPIYNEENQIDGTITAVIDGARPSQTIADIAISAHSKITLINRNTYGIVGSSNLEDVTTHKKFTDLYPEIPEETFKQLVKAASDGETLGSTYKDKGTTYSVVAGSAGTNSDWLIMLTAPESDFFSGLTRMSHTMIIVGIAGSILALTIIFFILSVSLKPLTHVHTAIKEIATGNADLTKRIKISSNDEIGSVVKQFNKFSDKLHGIITDIKESKNKLVNAGDEMRDASENTTSAITEILANIDSVLGQITNQSASVEETAGAVNQIASNIESLKQMIETQSAGVTQASAAVEEMIGNIGSVNQSVEKMAESFENLQKDAQNGASKQNDVNERIEQIETQSQMLQEANTAIANIAAQTNLLAMNAAIEAAHAGEAGKGFSVVADEIRKLSETSTGQSKTIADQLNKIMESINGVVQASAESSSAFNSVSQKITSTDELVRQIKSAMEEQTEGSKQIGDALHTMNDSTSEVKSAAAEMASGNQAILEEVKHLQNATASMKDSVSEMSIGAKKINETGAELKDISSLMKQSISKIDDQIDQFKV